MLGAFVPWLMLNRDDLVVLIHPETGDDLTDHTAHAAWFGADLPLRLEAFGGKNLITAAQAAAMRCIVAPGTLIATRP